MHFPKGLGQNAVFIVGLLFVTIFYFTSGQELFQNYKKRLTPTSCRALIPKLKRSVPKDWKAHCEDNNLFIEYELDLPPGLGAQEQRAFLYRSLAHALQKVSRSSPEEHLSHTGQIKITQRSQALVIHGATTGKMISGLSWLEGEALANHLRATVKIQEESP